MGDIKDSLNATVKGLSDQNYEESVAFYRFWSNVGYTHAELSSENISATILKNSGSGAVAPEEDKLFHPKAHLLLRFAGDVESGCIDPRISGLRSRLCAGALRGFFNDNVRSVWDRDRGCNPVRWGTEYRTAVESNFIAWWANSGYVDQATIRNHILQSLISHPKLYDHQANALIILFKIAGATFEAYTDPSVVDRCFELLKNHYNRDSVKGRLVQVRPPRSGRRASSKWESQEILGLRERGWEGLPPPPEFGIRAQEHPHTRQEDPSATPVAISLGLPSTDSEPQVIVTQPPPPEHETVLEAETTSDPPVIQSPTISIASLSDFTVGDVSDDESPADPTTITPHDTFYLEDGNVEVLCGKTLFRVHPTILSFHSAALRQMFVQANLATAESPNGCPRISSSDKAQDFATLLKMIYLPEFPERNKVPDFNTFSSLLRITAKYEIPTVRSRLLEAIQDAYPEAFEGVTPTKPLGEKVFSGPTPHPNEVLNLFIQQKLTSALPMAYYMAARKGLNSLMDRHLPRSAMLTPDVLQSSISGLMALREIERDEVYHLVFGSKVPQPCPESKCRSRRPATLEAYKKVFDYIVGSSQPGTKVLQVPKFHQDEGGNTIRLFPDLCRGCVKSWEVGHADLRRQVWAMLPSVFGLKD